VASASEQVRCEDILTIGDDFEVAPKDTLVTAPELQIGQIKPSFLAKHSTQYDKELPPDTIENQGCWGVCHLYQRGNSLERSYKRRTSESIHLSRDYMALVRIFNSTVEAMTRSTGGVAINVGANPFESRAFVQKFGVMPEDVFHMLQNYKAFNASERLNGMLQNFAARFRIEISKYKIDKENPNSEQSKKNDEIRQKILAARIDELGNFFEANFFTLEPFEYGGKKYKNATDFAKQNFPELYEKEIAVFIEHDKAGIGNAYENSGNVTSVAMGFADFERLIIETIDSGKSVPFNYYHKPEYIDEKTGIMSVAAFNIPTNMRPLPKMQRVDFNLNFGSHAAEIVGYKLNKYGRIAQLKIRNNYGDNSGDHGYYHMYFDYFRLFGDSILLDTSLFPIIPTATNP
jgi:bleomycin hydrolase